MRAPVLALAALLVAGPAWADSVSDRQLKRAIRGAAPDRLAALKAAEEAHTEAESGVKEAEGLLSTAELAQVASKARLDALYVHLTAIEAERQWAEAAGERERLADLFAEKRSADQHLGWRAALHEVSRARVVHAARALELRIAEREVREGVLDLVRMRTYVELKGEDAELEKQIGDRQAALGRAEVQRHDIELEVARAAALIDVVELDATRLAH